MATALLNPVSEREVTLSEIPATIRELRESWAVAYTRANELERERAEAVQRAADWEAIALSNGEELARAKVALERVELQFRVSREIDNREIQSLRQRIYSDLASYRDAIRTIYDATVGTTGPVTDVVHETVRALAECDDTDSDPLFDTCELCGPYDADDNPMPGCRDCFGGKVIA